MKNKKQLHRYTLSYQFNVLLCLLLFIPYSKLFHIKG